MNEVIQYVEKISLPAEAVLLEWIKEDVELKTKLVSGETVVVVGTDQQFTLAKGLKEAFPEVEVVVIEKNKEIEKWAEQNLSDEDEISLIVRELGEEKSDDINELAKLVIVKHLLHLVRDKSGMLEQLQKMVKADGKLVVSVPYFFQRGVGKEIEKLGWAYEKAKIGKGFGKSIAWKLMQD